MAIWGEIGIFSDKAMFYIYFSWSAHCGVGRLNIVHSIYIYTWSLEDVNFRAGPCLPMKHAPTRQDTPLFGKHAPNDIDHIYEGSSFLMNSMISPLP